MIADPLIAVKAHNLHSSDIQTHTTSEKAESLAEMPMTGIR